MIPESDNSWECKQAVLSQVPFVICRGCLLPFVVDERIISANFHEFACWCSVCTAGPVSKMSKRVVDYYLERQKNYGTFYHTFDDYSQRGKETDLAALHSVAAGLRAQDRCEDLVDELRR